MQTKKNSNLIMKDQLSIRNLLEVKKFFHFFFYYFYFDYFYFIHLSPAFCSVVTGSSGRNEFWFIDSPSSGSFRVTKVNLQTMEIINVGGTLLTPAGGNPWVAASSSVFGHSNVWMLTTGQSPQWRRYFCTSTNCSQQQAFSSNTFASSSAAFTDGKKEKRKQINTNK